MCAVPSAARADAVVLDGTPLNIYADGLGAIQVRQDGQAAGLFYPPDANPAHAGLELKVAAAYFPLQFEFDIAPGRAAIEPATVVDQGNGTRVLHSVYAVGPLLRVAEDLTYVDGSHQLAAHYGITNVSAAPVSLLAGELADLYVGANDSGNGVASPAAPRFVGGRDQAGGLVSGLQEVTPWGAFQEGDFESVFQNFSGCGLNNTVDPSVPDNGVGVQFPLDNVAPGETRGLDVRWLLASVAPPGTASPASAAAGEPPPPVLGKTVNLKLANGIVKYKLPGSTTFKRLTVPIQVPVGTTLDTLLGRVTLTSAADPNGGTQHAWFYTGVFTVSQHVSAKPVTDLTLPRGALNCKKASKASASAAKPKQRKLWGDGSGSFRTRGHFSSATVRGTKWVVIDRCDGTYTRVVRGVVAVRDEVRHKTILVRPGKPYLARKK